MSANKSVVKLATTSIILLTFACSDQFVKDFLPKLHYEYGESSITLFAEDPIRLGFNVIEWRSGDRSVITKLDQYHVFRNFIQADGGSRALNLANDQLYIFPAQQSFGRGTTTIVDLSQGIQAQSLEFQSFWFDLGTGTILINGVEGWYCLQDRSNQYFVSVDELSPFLCAVSEDECTIFATDDTRRKLIRQNCNGSARREVSLIEPIHNIRSSVTFFDDQLFMITTTPDPVRRFERHLADAFFLEIDFGDLTVSERHITSGYSRSPEFIGASSTSLLIVEGDNLHEFFPSDRNWECVKTCTEAAKFCDHYDEQEMALIKNEYFSCGTSSPLISGAYNERN